MTFSKLFTCLLSVAILATPLPRRNGNNIRNKARYKGEST